MALGSDLLPPDLNQRVRKLEEIADPRKSGGWRDMFKRAKTIYWDARKNGRDENAALAAALGECLGEGWGGRLVELAFDTQDDPPPPKKSKSD